MTDLKIGLDVSGVSSGTKVIKKNFDKIEKSTKEMIKSVDLLEKTFKDFDKSFKSAESTLKRMDTAYKKQAKTLNNSSKSIAAYNKSIVDSAKKQREMATAQKVLEEGTRRLNAGLDNTREFTLKYGKALSLVKKGLKDSYGENKSYLRSLKRTDEALNRVKVAQNATANAFRRGTAALKKINAEQRAMVKSSRQMKTSLNITTVALGNLAAKGLGAVAQQLSQAPRMFKEYSDEWLKVTNVIKLGVKTEEELLKVREKVFQTSQETRTDLSAQTTLFNRLTLAQKDLGASSDQILGVIRGVGHALGVTATSAVESRGALIQLSQAFGQGIVRAEEFNSIMEGTPRIAQAVADGFGVTRAQLRGMVLDGKVTSREFFEAFQTQLPILETEFSNVEITIDGALTTIRNGMVKVIGQFNELTGAAPALAKGLRAFGEVLGFIADKIALINESTREKTLAEQLKGLEEEKDSLLAGKKDQQQIWQEASDKTVEIIKNRNLQLAAEEASRQAKGDRYKNIQAGAKQGLEDPLTEIELIELRIADVKLKIAQKSDNDLKTLQEKAIQDSLKAQNVFEKQKIINMENAFKNHNILSKELEEYKIAQFKKDKEAYIKNTDDKITAEAVFQKRIFDMYYKANTAKRKLEADKLKAEKKAEADRKKWEADKKRLQKIEHDLALKTLEENREINIEKAAILEDFNKAFEEATLDRYDIALVELQREYDAYALVIKDKEKLEEWFSAAKAKIEKERTDETQKELDKSLKVQKRAYDQMLKNIQDETSGFFKDLFSGQLDSFEDLTDSMVNLFTDMLAEMAAKAIAEPILMPLVQSFLGGGISGTMSSVGGVIGEMMSDPGGSIGGITDILSFGKNAYDMAFGAGGQAYDFLTALGVPGAVPTSAGALAAGAELGWGATAAADIGAAGTAATSSLAGQLSAALPAIGAAVGVVSLALSQHQKIQADRPAISFSTENSALNNRGRFVGGGVGSEAFSSVGFGFQTGSDTQTAQMVSDYFETVFSTLDKVTEASIEDVLSNLRATKTSVFLTGEKSIEELSDKVFDKYFGEFLLGMFPEHGSRSVYDYTKYDYDQPTAGRDESFNRITGRDAFELGQDSYIAKYDDWIATGQEKEKEISALVDTLDAKFFDAIVPDGTKFEGLVRFGEVVQNNAKFWDDFSRQMDEFGETSVKAFQNLSLIDEVLTAIGASETTENVTALDILIESINDEFSGLVRTLEDAHAATETLDMVENKRLQTIGNLITGISEQSIQSSLLSGSNIADSFSKGLANVLSGTVATEMWSTIFEDINEQAAIAYNEGGIDKLLEIAPDMIDSWDLSAWDDAINQIAELTGSVKDLAVEAEVAEENLYPLSDRHSLRDFQLMLAGATELDLISNRLQAQNYGEPWSDLSKPGVQQNWIDWTADTKRNEIVAYLEEVDLSITDFITDITYMYDSLTAAEEELANAREGAIDTIQSLIDELEGGELSPVQSLEYFENKYLAALSGVETAETPEEILNAASTLTTAAPEYLDFVRAYGGENYKDIFDQVLGDLSSAQSILGGTNESSQTEDLLTEGVLGLLAWTEEYKVITDTETNISVVVYVGDTEIKDIIVESVRNDTEVQEAINDVGGI